MSGSEVAFFSLTPNEKEVLNSSNSKAHLIIKKLLAAPKILLATLLISNNFINVTIVILANDIINSIFDFATIPDWLNFSIQVVGITFMILLFGEVTPKVYATKHALELAKIMAKPITLLIKLFKPISSLLIFSTGLIGKSVKKKGLDVSVEELSQALDLAEDIVNNPNWSSWLPDREHAKYVIGQIDKVNSAEIKPLIFAGYGKGFEDIVEERLQLLSVARAKIMKDWNIS